MVVLGVGVLPRTILAKEAGLRVDNGDLSEVRETVRESWLGVIGVRSDLWPREVPSHTAQNRQHGDYYDDHCSDVCLRGP